MRGSAPPENWCRLRSRIAPPGTRHRLRKDCSWWKNPSAWAGRDLTSYRRRLRRCTPRPRRQRKPIGSRLPLFMPFLREPSRSPVIALNHAVAVAMSRGFETGLELIEQIAAPGNLDSYYLYHAARADLLRRLQRNEEALAAYERALSLSANAVERRYLRRRMAELSNL